MAFPWLVPPLAKSTKEAYETQQKESPVVLLGFWCAVVAALLALTDHQPPLLLLALLCGLLWICWFPACSVCRPSLAVTLCLPSWLISMPCSDQCVKSAHPAPRPSNLSLSTKPIWLVHLCLQPDSDFPVRVFRPSKVPVLTAPSAIYLMDSSFRAGSDPSNRLL